MAQKNSRSQKSRLELLLSSPGTGKTSYCIELFKNEILKKKAGLDSRSFFVLPSREHADRIRALILKKDVPGLFNAHILTINDLTARLLGGSPESNLTDSIRKSILKEILSDGDFPYFQSVKDTNGFYELLIDTIKELKANLITMTELERASQTLLKKTNFRAKFRDFSVVIKRYGATLEKWGLKEPEDDIKALLQKRKEKLLMDLVIFDGFFHFTRAQKILIESLSCLSSHVVVSLTLPPDSQKRESLFYFPLKTKEFLLKAGFVANSKDFLKNYRTDDPALLHLEKNVFKEKPDHFKEKLSSIAIFEADGIRGEIEMIAREIKKLYRETTAHYSDMCLILRSIGNYEKIIESVFEEYEIPVYIHERKRLIEHGFTRTLYRFLNLIAEGWKREDLFYFLKSSFLSSVVSLSDILELEAIAFQKNILEGRQKWESLASDPALLEPVRMFLQKLFGWETTLLNVKNVPQFKNSLFSFLREFRIIRNEGINGEKEEDQLDGMVFKNISLLLENLRKYYAGSVQRQFFATVFIKDFQESLETSLFSLKPVGKNRVQVYDVVIAMPKEYKVVFMAGLLEKNFPMSISEDPLLKDDERRTINQNHLLLEERHWRASGERYFFYMGIARAKEKIVFCYPSRDSDGKLSLPSFFIEEVKKCFRENDILVQRKRLGEFLPEPVEWEIQEEALKGVSRALFRPESEIRKDAPDFYQALPFFFDEWKNEERFVDIIACGRSLGDAVIQDTRIKSIFSNFKGPFSATRLEVFATCAFKYFASRVLRLTEPLEGRQFIEMGNILHKVLEGFYKELPEALKRDKNYWDDLILVKKTLYKKLDEVFQTNGFGHEPLYRQKIYREWMRETIDLFALQEQGFFRRRNVLPSYFEYEFHDLKVQGVHGEKINLEGKIDRIDVVLGEKKALVVDYKRSKRSTTITEKLSKGLELQLPLYILAVERFLNLKVIGAELRFLKDSKTEGIYEESAREALGLSGQKATYEEVEFEHLLLQAQERIRNNVARLQSADIRVKSKSCEFCSLSPVCRFEPWKLIYSEGEKDGN